VKKQLPHLSKQTLVAIGLAVGGIAIGLLGYFVAVSPEKAKLASVDKQIDAAHASLASAEQAPVNAKSTPAKATDLFRLSTAMPGTDDMPGVLISLSQLAKSSKVSLLSVTPSADVAENGYSQIPISLQVSGKFDGLMKFLSSMRHAVVLHGDKVKVENRLFVPTSTAITSSDGKSVQATISLDAFVYGTAPVASTDTNSTATTTSTTG
jgi:Tfp pilus assembly protein PilO